MINLQYKLRIWQKILNKAPNDKNFSCLYFGPPKCPECERAKLKKNAILKCGTLIAHNFSFLKYRYIFNFSPILSYLPFISIFSVFRDVIFQSNFLWFSFLFNKYTYIPNSKIVLSLPRPSFDQDNYRIRYICMFIVY